MRDVKPPEIRRQEIMDTSLQLFIEKGYLKTRTQDIVNRLGISRGLLYYHFKDKEDILYCLVKRDSAPLFKRLKQITNNQELTPVQKVKQFFEATLIDTSSITREKVELQKSVELEDNRYLIDRFSHEIVNTISHDLTQIFKQGMEEGVFIISNPKELAHFLITAYVFTSNEVNQLDGKTVSRYLDTFHNMVNQLLQQVIFDKE